MAAPKLKPIPQSLEELAALKDYKVTIQKSQLLADAFLVFIQLRLFSTFFLLKKKLCCYDIEFSFRHL